MAYLQCARYRQNCCVGVSPVIDTERDTYYVLGGGAVVNCQACAEARGWHLLRQTEALNWVQRRPTPPTEHPADPPPLQTPRLDTVVEEMEVEATALQRRLQTMNVAEFRAFLESGPASQVTAVETLQRLAELVYMMLTADAFHQFHATLSLLRWWPKLCDWACPAQLSEPYNQRAALHLHDMRKNAWLQQRLACLYCWRACHECLGDLVAQPALAALLCETTGHLYSEAWRQCQPRRPDPLFLL